MDDLSCELVVDHELAEAGIVDRYDAPVVLQRGVVTGRGIVAGGGRGGDGRKRPRPGRGALAGRRVREAAGFHPF